MRLFRVKGWIAAAMALAGAISVPASADEGGEPFSIGDSLAHGRFTLELRPRYNRIEESNLDERTEAGTVRAVAGWRSAPFAGFRVTLQAIHTDQAGSDLNDDPTMLATSRYPLLPDPRYTGVNEAHVEYSGIEGLRMRAGRQVVRLDNQRWVSDNDFRQIPQLFDGVSATYEGIERVQLAAQRYWRVRTTSGQTQPLQLTLARAAWNPLEGQSLSAYAVFHDQAQNGALTGFADSSYRVTGVKAEGSAARIGSIEVPYLAEFAWQRPYANGDSRIDANYWRLGAGLAATGWTARYDYEVKGSNHGAYGVQMPLTDLYAFNGWTLHFFNTPAQGLRDQWLTLRCAVSKLTLYGEAHRFRSDFGGTDLGRELDASVTYPIVENAVLRLQHARYDPGSDTPDPRIRKTWLTLTYTY